MNEFQDFATKNKCAEYLPFLGEFIVGTVTVVIKL